MTDKDKLKVISPSVFLEEANPWKSLATIIIIICGIFFFLVVWSAFAKVNESTEVFGQVEPANKIEMIEHLEGGIVKSIKVQNGETVKKGQTLLIISVSKADAQLKQLLSRQM